MCKSSWGVYTALSAKYNINAYNVWIDEMARLMGCTKEILGAGNHYLSWWVHYSVAWMPSFISETRSYLLDIFCRAVIKLVLQMSY